MRLFAIGDLHLPGGEDKPMNVFGAHWDDHFSRIARAWRDAVRPEDTVLIPGDISWAMQPAAALPDLEQIAALPGRKILIRGNHDYWWNSITRVRSMLPEGMSAIQHDAVDLGACVVCGTRGWMIPTGENALTEEDGRIYRRELLRLELALEAAKRTAGDRPILVMLHYPPLYENERKSGFTGLMEAYGVQLCVYGHLHGAGIRAGFNGEAGGIRYRLTSCDSLDFRPLHLSPALWGGPETPSEN